jgi:phytoene dehydrogenase-like protein
MADNWDVLIIGGGHNGLIAASYLARAGLSVLVLERSPGFGGACVTEEIAPGVRASTGAHIVRTLSPQIVEELRLKERGFELYGREVSTFLPLPDGNHVLLHADEKRTLEELARHNPHDAESYVRLQGYLDRVERRLEPWWMHAPPSVEELSRVFSGREGELMLRDLLFTSVGDLMDEYFEASAIKAVLGVDGVLGTFAGPRTPGTTYALFHRSTGRTLGTRGTWGLVRGGLGALSNALADAAREHGVEIRTDCPVTSIEAENGRVRGVCVQGGEFIEAKTVMSSADPRTTFLRLLSREHLSANFVSRVQQYPMRGFGMKMHLVLRELPDFAAIPGTEPGPHHYGRLVIAPSLEYMHQAYGDGRVGRFSSQPIIEGVIPTLDDPTLAPEGTHLLSLWVQFAPYHLSEGSWSELGDRAGDCVVEVLTRYAPNLRDAIVARHMLTPQRIEEQFGLAWGHPDHGEMRPGFVMSFRPVPGWSRYRTPIQGLYMCGAGAHPGGGVSGNPGRNAAYALLDDLDIEEDPAS